jgi:hypothetical protein
VISGEMLEVATDTTAEGGERRGRFFLGLASSPESCELAGVVEACVKSGEGSGGADLFFFGLVDLVEEGFFGGTLVRERDLEVRKVGEGGVA